MSFEGIRPSQGAVEKQQVKIPRFIPKDGVVDVRTVDDVDALEPGVIAHLVVWDEEVAMDLIVAGVPLTLLSREDHDALADDEDFDPDGFGILDGDIWFPGLSVPFEARADGWHLPDDVDVEALLASGEEE